MKIYQEALVASGREHAKQGRWDEAARDLVEAIDRSEDRGWYRAPKLIACREASAFDELFRRVVKLRPESGALWIGRGQRRALEGRWSDAKEDFERGLHPSDVLEEVVEYAALLLLCEDRDGYAKFCEQLASRPGEPHNVHAAYFMASALALGELSVEDAARCVKWAEEAVPIDHGAWRKHVLGLCLYRAQAYEQAMAVLHDANQQTDFWMHHCQNNAVMALCHYKMGDFSEAVHLLNGATNLLAARKSEILLHSSEAWLRCKVEIQEAESLLKGAPVEPKLSTFHGAGLAGDG